MVTLYATPVSDVLAASQEREADALLLEALPTIQRRATYLAWVYGWASPRIEADDLAQVGYLAAWEVLKQDRQFLGNPVAYVVVVAKNAMRRYCGRHASLITSPYKHRGYQPPLAVLSLDAPLSPGAAFTLLDVLEAGGTSA